MERERKGVADSDAQPWFPRGEEGDGVVAFLQPAGRKEAGLRAKAEPEGFYEERPWTPTTGEDYLLARNPRSFYPSSTIYPRRLSKAQRVVGARRASYQAGDSSPARLTPIPFNKVAPLRDDGFVPIQKKVLLKDHLRNSMVEYPGSDGAAFSFASLALTLETELLEFQNDLRRRNEPQPSLTATVKSLEVLRRIAERPGPFQKVLMHVRAQLTQAIFAGAVPRDASSPAGSESGAQESDSSEMSVPYFFLYEQMRAELSKVRAEPGQGSWSEKPEDGDSIICALNGGQTVWGEMPGFPEARQSSPVSQKSPTSPKSTASNAPTKDETLFAKILELQKEKERLEHVNEELELQNTTMGWELEAKLGENEQLTKQSTELRGSFLRMKSDCMDLRAELVVVNAHSEKMFDQLQLTVSRQEHEQVLKEYEMQLQKQSETFRELLEEKYGDEDGVKLHEMAQSMTPRPNWRRTGTSKQILASCSIFPRHDSSAESVDKLLNGFSAQAAKLHTLQARMQELEGKKEGEEAEPSFFASMQVTNSWITCMGMGDDVPPLLRFNGQVPNLKMRKGDAERHIRNIWAAKAQHDAELAAAEKPRSDLSLFVFDYCKRKFNNQPKKMAEWGYNLIATLQQNSQDADCDLFLKILHQEESEDLYHDEIQEMDDVLYLALETDRKEHGGKPTGKCSKEGFLVAVRQHFLKSFEQTVELKKALDVVYGDKAVKFAYAELFADDRDLSQNEFAEEFRGQALKDRRHHKEQLEKLVESSRHPNGDKQVDVAKFAADLKLLDPTKTPKDIEIYLRRATQVKYGDLPATMEPWPFTRNLLTLGVCKLGRLSPIERKEVNLDLNAAFTASSIPRFALSRGGSEQFLAASDSNAVGDD